WRDGAAAPASRPARSRRHGLLRSTLCIREKLRRTQHHRRGDMAEDAWNANDPCMKRHVWNGVARLDMLGSGVPKVDLNLLAALGALLAEGRVAGAARRLNLSDSAMSRTLARLRAATGDPLLVRAGRGMVRTPHAETLRDRVRDLTQDALSVLRPSPR